MAKQGVISETQMKQMTNQLEGFLLLKFIFILSKVTFYGFTFHFSLN